MDHVEIDTPVRLAGGASAWSLPRKARCHHDRATSEGCRAVVPATTFVSILLTTLECQHYVDDMQTQDREFTTVADRLLTSIREMLDSQDAKTRVRAIHHFAAGVEALERQVLLDAQSSGLTWAQIGEVYGVSRQAAHRRFSDETVVPSDFFDQLLEDLDEDGEVIPTLARAAKGARRVASA